MRCAKTQTAILEYAEISLLKIIQEKLFSEEISPSITALCVEKFKAVLAQNFSWTVTARLRGKREEAQMDYAPGVLFCGTSIESQQL